MFVLRLIFSWVAFFALLKALFWPLRYWAENKMAQKTTRRSQKSGGATPLKQCSCCHMHLPEQEGSFFGDFFFCSEQCRYDFYS